MVSFVTKSGKRVSFTPKGEKRSRPKSKPRHTSMAKQKRRGGGGGRRKIRHHRMGLVGQATKTLRRIAYAIPKVAGYALVGFGGVLLAYPIYDGFRRFDKSNPAATAGGVAGSLKSAALPAAGMIVGGMVLSRAASAIH